jgi:hypothetical protein
VAGRYTPDVLFLFTMLFACDLSAPLPKREDQAKPPYKEAPEKRVPDAAMMDTGVWAEGGNLIRQISYLPPSPTAFDDVRAEVQIDTIPGMDIDYAWMINGRKSLSARSQVLRQTSFSKGDTVQVIITLEYRGRKATRDGPPVTIGNTPPRILTKTNTLTQLDGFRVRAEDPDGGAVRYRMDAAPPGLTIGETTGVFRYAPSKSAEGGRYEIVVVASDPEDAQSEWRLVVTVRGGSHSAEAKARRAKAKAAWEAKRKAGAAAK